jgi:hypothetical protein
MGLTYLGVCIVLLLAMHGVEQLFKGDDNGTITTKKTDHHSRHADRL